MNFFLVYREKVGSITPLTIPVRLVRQCVPLRVSESGVFSRKYRSETENFETKFPVHFRSGIGFRKSDCFGNYRNYRNCYRKFGQKKWSKMAPKWSKNGPKHKMLIISAPERPRMVLRPFLTCMFLA